MCRIAGKLWFVERQAVRFCSKAGIGREWRLPKPCFIDIFTKTALRTESLTAQDNYGRIIDVIWRTFVLMDIDDDRLE